MASQATAEAAPMPTEDALVYKQLDDYDWAADNEFQGGLQAILGSTADPARAEHITLRARCFYFSRKKDTRIDFNSYLAWRSMQSSTPAVNGESAGSATSQPSSPAERRASVAQQYDSVANATNPTEPPAPYPTTFEQIVELISTGQPIPGIKDVPNTVLEGQASQTSVARRKKPWEKNEDAPVEAESSDGVTMNA